jgi:hypothetical protein
MAETLLDRAVMLDADTLNRRIRELWVDGELPEARREDYLRLVVAWAAASRQGEVAEAA